MENDNRPVIDIRFGCIWRLAYLLVIVFTVLRVAGVIDWAVGWILFPLIAAVAIEVITTIAVVIILTLFH